MIDTQNEKTKHIFTIIVLLQLVLRSYGIKSLGGTFADYSLIVISIFVYTKQKRILTDRTAELSYLPFLFYLIINFFLTFHTEFPVSDQIIDWVRSILCYFIIIFGIKRYFDYEFGFKLYKYMSVIATIFLIIQYVAVVFGGYYISGFWGPFSLIDSLEMYRDYGLYSISTYRPNSFFTEPAHYATFIIPFFSINCFEKLNSKSILITIFLTFGILLSGSTTGLVVCGICVVVWLFRFVKETKNYKYIFIVVVFSVVAYSIVSDMDSFKFMLYRTFESDNAANSRLRWFSGYTFPFEGMLGYLFGVGNCDLVLKRGQGWIPGWALLFQDYGIIGTIIYMGCSIFFWKKSTSKSRTIMILFWIVSIGAEVIVDQHMLYFLAFAIAENKQQKQERSAFQK